MKRIALTITVISCLFLTTAVFAADEITAFTTNMLKELAVKNSRQAAVDDLDIKINEDRFADAQEDAEDNDYIGGDRTDRLKRRIIVEVDTLAAQAQLDVAARTKKDNLTKLQNDTYKATIHLLLLNKELAKEKEKLDYLFEKSDIELAKLNRGSSTQTAVRDIHIQLENKKIDVETVKNKISAAEYEINRLLHRHITEKITLEDDLTLSETPKVDLEEVIKASLAENTAVFDKEQDLKAKNLKLSLTAKEYDEDEKEYREVKYEVEAARIILNDTRINLEVDIRNKYADLLNRLDQYEVAQAYLELSEKKLAVAELKYDAGLDDRGTFLSQKEMYLDAVYDRYSAVYAFNTALADFNYAAGIGSKDA